MPLFSVFVCISIIILGFVLIISRNRTPLQIMLFGIQLTLVGGALMLIHWGGTPLWMIPYMFVLLGFVCSIIGMCKKEVK
jgi:hypothetical protein